MTGALLVDRPGGDLLGGVLGATPLEQAVLDVLVLSLPLGSPRWLWHARRLPHRPGPDATVAGMGVTSAVDGFQRRHPVLGFPLAVVYKFFDDQGVYLAALITYYGFLSLFPLLLLLASVLGFVLRDDPDLQQRILDSTISQFPVIGDQLRGSQGLEGSGVALVVGALVAHLRRPRRRPGAAERAEHRLGGAAQRPARTR